jgi:hypothetical protein
MTDSLTLFECAGVDRAGGLTVGTMGTTQRQDVLNIWAHDRQAIISEADAARLVAALQGWLARRGCSYTVGP